MKPFKGFPRPHSHLVTRQLSHNGKRYRITQVGREGDYVQCSEVDSVSRDILRLPMKDALEKLIPQTTNKM